jgi:hypothetical protein
LLHGCERAWKGTSLTMCAMTGGNFDDEEWLEGGKLDGLLLAARRRERHLLLAVRCRGGFLPKIISYKGVLRLSRPCYINTLYN